ncbi:MAG TPA: hypothetical protein VE615_12555, partial [Gaiellaceae bacterium]|nr:hypothetical protein [Gaiellaceae bacterium]
PRSSSPATWPAASRLARRLRAHPVRVGVVDRRCDLAAVAALLLAEPWPVLVFSLAAALAVLVLHRSNLARLRAGTETRVQLRRRRPAQA